jgi:hypothetical protein
VVLNSGHHYSPAALGHAEQLADEHNLQNHPAVFETEAVA